VRVQSSLQLAGIAAAMVVAAVPAQAQPAIRTGGALVFGMYTPSAPHPFLGIAFGPTSGSTALEVEYAGTVGRSSDIDTSASITVNFLFQTPLTIRNAQIYGSAGLGLYGESRPDGHGSGELEAVVFGTGARIPLDGAFRLRLDYRVFLVHREATDSRRGTLPPQRLSVGLSFGF
jgi:hypothetical protein